MAHSTAHPPSRTADPTQAPITQSYQWPSAEPPRSAIGSLLHLAAAPAVPTCPDCDAPKELVPPALFWRACRHCSPQTFDRAAGRIER